jgi:hypothetical protein
LGTHEVGDLDDNVLEVLLVDFAFSKEMVFDKWYVVNP